MNEWKSMYQCDNCGYISGWKYDRVCGGCGEMKKEDPLNGYKGWSAVAVRWVKDEKWWNPLSWHKGHWEVKNNE